MTIEIVELLRAFQSTLGSVRPDDADDADTWDRIERGIAHLTQPAQAVDVGVIREVIATLEADGDEHGVADKLTHALAGEKAGDLQPEDSRCPPTYRREEAVKALIGMGWTWDGRQWVSGNKAESPLSKLQKTLMLRAKALKESGDEWMEDMGDHYEGIAEELAAAMLPTPPTDGEE